MRAMMDFRVSILNKVLQTFKVKNFRFRMGVWPLSFLGTRKLVL